MKSNLSSAFLLSFCLCFALLSTYSVRASDATDVSWKAHLAASKLLLEDQSYCYTNPKATRERPSERPVEGLNLDLRVRLASVSKLITTLWSLDVLGANFKYKTRLYLKERNLHIEGSADPFMGNEKIYFLLSQLNELGISHLDRITFDKNFIVFPNAQGHIEEYPVITPEKIASNLRAYFNTASWSQAMKADYARVWALSAPGRMKKEVNFSVDSIEDTGGNPFDEESNVQMFTLSSPPMHRYLKEMNVESNNYVAQMLFLQLGGVNEFLSYMVENYRMGTKTLRFWSGSGLPTIEDGIRYDNYATCASILTLVESLKNKLKKQDLTLEDIVAVPGSDQGTFRNRVFPSDYKNAFVAKTGTLMHTSTLAGAMSTKSGMSYYGIFNQSTDIESSKKVQNAMVAVLMSELGGPKAFNYKVEPFDPYGEESLKNLFKTKSTFLPVEENLY